MALRQVLGGVVMVVGLGGLGACGSSGATGTTTGGAPTKVTLPAEVIEDACWSAIVDLECAVTTSAEGHRFSSCDCEATAEGDTATMTVKGEKMDGAAVDETMTLSRTAEGWVIAPEE